MGEIPRPDNKIVMGDFNAQIGRKGLLARRKLWEGCLRAKDLITEKDS